MKRFLISTALLAVSIFLTRAIVLSKFGLILLAITFVHICYKKSIKEALEAIGGFFWEIAYTIDLLGNILLQTPMNLLFTKGNYHPYGEVGETISSATGRNLERQTLNKVGRFFARFLDFFLGKNHCIESIAK